MPVGGGEETKVLDSVHFAGHWAVGEQGIYFFGPEDDKGHSDINFYDFATGKTSKILTIEKVSLRAHRNFPRRPDDSLHAG